MTKSVGGCEHVRLVIMTTLATTPTLDITPTLATTATLEIQAAPPTPAASTLSSTQLKALCKAHGIHGYSNKKKDVLVGMVTGHTAAAAEAVVVAAEAQRTKKNAGANEHKDLIKIVAAIKDKTALGLRLCAAFSVLEPGSEILDARLGEGGTRSTHHDIEVLVRRSADSEPQWKCVEHKGSSRITPFVDGAVPWAASVQFHNGRAEQYASCPKFARMWYDHWIGTGQLTADWKLEEFTQPTYEEWYERACCVSAAKSLKNPWVIELEKKVKLERKGKPGLKGDYLLIERAPIVSRFVSEFTEEDRIELMRQINDVATAVFKEKEYWLCIRGSLDGEFIVRWFPEFIFTPVVRIDILTELDVKFRCTCANGHIIIGTLRFGGGTGICNLRLGLK